MDSDRTFTAFAGDQLIVSGLMETVVVRTKERLDQGESRPVLIFTDRTGTQVDFDFRGTPAEVLARLPSHPMFVPSEPAAKARTGPGRPKLGVVCREVSLLPRHWDWLDRQPVGVSATLRRLVDEARKSGHGAELARIAREAVGKFMWEMAGNRPGFEEASRALFARDQARLLSLIQEWPEDIRAHVTRLVGEAVRLEREVTAGSGPS